MSTSQKVTTNVRKPFLTKQKRSKNWYIVTTNPVTKKRSYKSTGTEDKEKAEIALRELESSIGLSRHLGGEKDKLRSAILASTENTLDLTIQDKTSLDQIWQEYQRNERVRALSPRTLHSNKLILEAFLKFVSEAGIETVEQITYNVCKAYIDKLRIDGKSDGTLKNHRNNLHGIFSKVKRPLGLKENPFEDVETPFRPKRKTHRCFKPHELEKLLEVASKDWRVIISLSLYTGLRFGDCCNFRLDYVDYDRNLIDTEPGKTKRFNTRVIIPLHRQLRSELQSYTNALTGYLVPHFAQKHSSGTGLLSREFNALLRALEMPKENSEGILDFHSLRHTFNTILANNGVDISTRMKLVGHSNVETNQIYNHAIEPLKLAIDAVPTIGSNGV